MFLSHCIPLLDRSGLNIAGAFNEGHSTPVEEVPEVLLFCLKTLKSIFAPSPGLRPHKSQ